MGDGFFVAGVAVDDDDLGDGEVLLPGGLKFTLKKGWGEVLAGERAVFAGVGEGDFDEEDLGRGRVRKEGEQAAACVAGEGGGGGTPADEVADGGGAVGDGDGENFEAADVEGAVGGDGVKAILGAFRRGAEGEVGVEEAIEEVGSQGVEGVGEGENVDGCAVVHGLEAEAGEVPDVVEVSVGEEDGPEPVFFVVGEAGREATSVDGEGVIDEEAGVAGVGSLDVMGA